MTWNALAQAHLSARKPAMRHWLIHVRSRDLTTGDPYPIGLWTGDDHETLTVEGEARLYYGAQGEVTIPNIAYGSGTDIVSDEITMPVSPEAEILVRGTNLRFAPIEMHCALYDAEDGDLLDVRRFFKGTIDGAPILTPALNGVASFSLKMVSSARAGTMTTKAKKSDQSQRIRQGDRLRRYGDLGKVAADPWGGKS